MVRSWHRLGGDGGGQGLRSLVAWGWECLQGCLPFYVGSYVQASEPRRGLSFRNVVRCQLGDPAKKKPPEGAQEEARGNWRQVT